MARFNTPSVGTKVTNKAGGEAYQESAKLELVSLLLTSFLGNQHYRTGDQALARLVELVGKVDPKFAAKAAVYARNEFGMRSVSHVVAGEIGHTVKGEEWTRPFYGSVVHRVDDITEIMSYYLGTYGKPLPNSMKRGLGEALGKFNEYQLGKYRGEGNQLSLVDAVNLIRPKPTDTNREALRKLVAGELRSTDTWETMLSAAKNDAEKAQVWKVLLSEHKLGYFALLRNLRNIIEQADEATLQIALEQLQDAEAIKKSLVLPFRFYTAYNEIAQISGKGARATMTALAVALDKSFVNIPKLDGNTLVVVDHSGSMDSPMSDRSKATMFQIGALFGVALAKSNNADLLYFGDIAKHYNVTDGSAISQMQHLEGLNRGYGDTAVGHGTNFNAIFEEAHEKYDRIVILSDLQAWATGGWRSNVPTAALNDYKRRAGANPKIYSFDLAGLGTLQFPEPSVYALAGFSDKVFDLMQALEDDRNALVNRIEAVQL